MVEDGTKYSDYNVALSQRNRKVDTDTSDIIPSEPLIHPEEPFDLEGFLRAALLSTESCGVWWIAWQVMRRLEWNWDFMIQNHLKIKEMVYGVMEEDSWKRKEELLVQMIHEVEALNEALPSRDSLGARELWERFKIKSAPLFDERYFSASLVPAEWVEDVSILIQEVQARFPDIRIRQIKEKYGNLCFYFDVPDHAASKEIDNMIMRCKKRLGERGVYPLVVQGDG